MTDETRPGGPGSQETPIRRRFDPFRNLGPIASSDTVTQKRELATRSDLKTIKKAGVRVHGSKVVTDDVKKLKSLSEAPGIAPGALGNYYVEPVRIEYYIPKESKFAVETRSLYVPLIDPVIRPQDEVLKWASDKNRFVDLMEVMNEFPQTITGLLESYHEVLNLYEHISRVMRQAEATDPELYRTAFYLCETLFEYEPTLAALEFMGDFLTYNLNWLVRKMNQLGVEFRASDKIVSYFIKLRNEYWEENNMDYDERFEILASLFFDQAYPHRGVSIVEEDFLFEVFDRNR
ncbi:MAG: hypothetical protein JNM27_06590 [Leptospirales bacterium]|nr:hypothetical protein [Leptospirales bacterium]